MPYIEQYINAGSTTTNDYFLISRNNVYYKLKQSDFYTEILTAVGSLALSIDELTDVDTTTTTPVIRDVLKWDGSNWVNDKLNVVNKTAAYTATLADDFITVDTSSGSVTVTLPAVATTTGHEYNIVKITAANTLTVDAAGAELINGATTITTTTQWATIRLVSNGTYWVASTL